MRLALAQINTVVGDLDGNRALILARLDEARAAGADLVLFPELAVTSLPARGPAPAAGVRARGAAVARRDRRGDRPGSRRSSGSPTSTATSTTRARSARTARCVAVYRKRFLPNYGVFDEQRYFASARDLVLLRLGRGLVGVTICEDMWQPGPPATDLALAGAQLLVNISASPFHVGKEREREEMFQQRARDTACVRRVRERGRRPGRADLRRALVRARRRGRGAGAGAGVRGGAARRRRRPDRGDRAAALGRAAAGAGAEQSDRPSASVGRAQPATGQAPKGPVTLQGLAPLDDELEQMRLALELGLRDYVDKNGFSDIVVGLSGGIDSALTVALAVEALGAGARARRLDAVALLVGGDARRRAAARREPRHRLPRDPDRADRRGLRAGAGAAASRGASAT